MAKCAEFRKRNANQHTVPLYLEEVAIAATETWAAPQASDHFPPHSPERIAAMKALGHGMRNLNDEASQWRAPKASDGEKEGPNMRGSKGDMPLPAQAANWTGPSASDGERGGKITDAMTGTSLAQQVNTIADTVLMKWAGPAAQNHKGSSEGSITRADGKSRADILSYQAEQFLHPPSSPDHPTLAGGSTSSTAGPNSNQPSVKRKLNPIFVEALMRWPTGLSGFERQATAWTRWWQQQLTYLSMLGCEMRTGGQLNLFGE